MLNDVRKNALKHFRRDLPSRTAIWFWFVRYQILICLRKHLNPARGSWLLQMSGLAWGAKLNAMLACSKEVVVVFNFCCSV